MLRPYNTDGMSVIVLTVFMDSGNAFAQFSSFLTFLLGFTFGTSFPYDFTTKCHLHVSVDCHRVSLASAIGMCMNQSVRGV